MMAALIATRERAGLSQRGLAKRLDRAHSFVGKLSQVSGSLMCWNFANTPMC